MLSFREADEGDVAAIADLHAQSWRTSYRGAYRDEFLDGDVFAERREVWEQRMSAPAANQFVLLACEEQRLAGFICAYGREDEEWGTLLDNLHVSPEFHRRGVGARLVTDLGSWCRRHYADCGLYLWVLEQNERAQSFYRSQGASDRGGAVFVPPGGGEIHSRRYAWTSVDEVGRSDAKGR